VATSLSWDYSRTAAQIIQAAYEDLGVVEPGGTVPSAHETMALARLNFMAKQMQGNSDLAPGFKVWTRQRVHLFLAKGQQTYLIGPASTDARATTRYGRTTIDAAEAIGQTVISVTATSDTTTEPGTTITATASDIIGIEQDDGTIHWSTVSSISAGDTITIADATTVAASVGNYVWYFTSRAQRIPLIETAYVRDENRNDRELEVYTDASEYDLGVVDKYADGTPTAILVEPLRITTRVTLNSQPTDVTEQVVLTGLYPAEDYDATSNDIAFPQEYFDFLHWQLAFRLSGPYRWTKEMEMNRQETMAWAKSLNPEKSTAYFQPNA
jgi:hypothetical protein